MIRKGLLKIGFLTMVFGLWAWQFGLPVFPIAAAAETPAAQQSKPSSPKWIAPDQEEAIKHSQQIVNFVGEVMDECKLCRQQRLRDQGLSVKDQSNSYFLLDSPIIKKTEDRYGPVRFMHSKHAALTKDCALCHHYRPVDENAQETTRCSACHQEPFRADHPERLGLKAAYHQQCMECHKEMNKGPIDCIGCHQKRTPDHKALVQLPPNPKPSEVTSECLRCHEAAGKDMLTTAHWLWKGPSPYTLKHRKAVEHGKATTAVNNF
jgi:hypothetical protein